MRECDSCQEIVELPTVAVFARREDAQPGKLVIPLQPLPPHDERVHDQLAHPGKLGERPAELLRRHVQQLGLVRFHARAGERRSALEHRDVADEIARARRGQDLLRAFAIFEDLHLAAEDDDEWEIALAGR